MEASRNQILRILREVKDPEIPVVDIVGLGMVREVQTVGKTLQVVITPTYMGCPALKTIEEEIVAILLRNGFENVVVRKVFKPAWSTDCITEETRQKLKEAGIAPPRKLNEQDDSLFGSDLKLVNCPYCDSEETEVKSAFGSTACKALYFCKSCHQPFEYFKCI